jgi:hypothetical protein
MLLVNTMNGSGVIAKIAGIESTANTRSVISTRISARNSGVIAHAALSEPAGAGSMTCLPAWRSWSTSAGASAW